MIFRMKFRKILYLRDSGRLRDDVSTDEITPAAILSHYDDAARRVSVHGLQGGRRRPRSARAPSHAGGFERDRRRASAMARARRASTARPRKSWPAFAWSSPRASSASIARTPTTSACSPRPTWASSSASQRGEDIDVERTGRGPRRARRRHPAQRRPAALRRSAPAARRSRRRRMRKRRPAHAVREDRCASPLRTPVTPAQPRPGEGTLRARGLALHPRVLHRHGGARAARTFGRPLPLRRPGIDPRVRGPHVLHRRESRPRSRAASSRTCARCSRRSATSSARHGLRFHRTLTDDEARADDGSNVAGISHAMMAEHYALPGQLVAGTDSHTPHSGALGCVAFGVGTTDMANALVTGAVRLTIPQALASSSTGRCRAGLERQGHRAASACPALHPRRRGCRQGVRVHRRRRSPRCPPTSARRSPT